MKERLQRRTSLLLAALLAVCLLAFFLGGLFRQTVLPVVLGCALVTSLVACSRPRTVSQPRAVCDADQEQPQIHQATREVLDSAATVQVEVLGAEYRRQKRRDVEEIVDSILDTCISLLGARLDAHTIVILFPTHDQGYSIRRFVSHSQYINKDAVIYPGVGVIGSFLKNGLKQLHLDEIVTDSMTLYYYSQDAGIRSLVASPIVVQGMERGVILADSTEKKHFTEEQHTYLSSLATLCGQAVYYTYLYNEHRLQYHHLVAMSSIEKFFFQMHDIDAVLDKMAEIIPYAFRCDRMTICLKNHDTGTATVRRAWGEQAEAFKGLTFSLSDKNLTGIVFAKNIALMRNFSDEKYEVRYRDDEVQNPELKSFIALPLGIESGSGMILLESNQRDGFRDNHKELLTRLATSAGIAIEKILVFKQTQSLATHDGLTGLVNHRQFQQLLKEAITRSIRYQEPLALVICDIDHFKKVNDTYGHRFGDLVLKEVAASLAGSIREDIDVAARYGGEEFALILEKTDARSALETVERIRRHAEKKSYASPKGTDMTVTMSFGVAIYGVHAKNQETLIQRADKALYRAKENGRNRSELYLEVSPG